MSNQRSSSRSVHSPSRDELRASVLLPVVISILIFVVGVVVFVLVPDEFALVTAAAIGVGLLAFLLYWTRKQPLGLRIMAVVVALPALAGMTLGMVNGRISQALLGFGVTFALLVLYRFIHTPVSYRFAYGRFRQGDLENALNLVNKAIAARPDFWESYQLRALIHLMQMDFARAERDAKEAIQRKPNAHPVYNTLGQIYLAQERYQEAAEMYQKALQLDKSNALYRYHLGLSQYRQAQWRSCAETMMSAIQGLRFVEYELQAHYYLWRCLQEMGEQAQADVVYEKFANYEEGLEPLRQQIKAQQGYPHAEKLQADLAAIEQIFTDVQRKSARKTRG